MVKTLWRQTNVIWNTIYTASLLSKSDHLKEHIIVGLWMANIELIYILEYLYVYHYTYTLYHGKAIIYIYCTQVALLSEWMYLWYGVDSVYIYIMQWIYSYTNSIDLILSFHDINTEMFTFGLHVTCFRVNAPGMFYQWRTPYCYLFFNLLPRFAIIFSYPKTPLLWIFYVIFFEFMNKFSDIFCKFSDYSEM